MSLTHIITIVFFLQTKIPVASFRFTSCYCCIHIHRQHLGYLNRFIYKYVDIFLQVVKQGSEMHTLNIRKQRNFLLCSTVSNIPFSYVCTYVCNIPHMHTYVKGMRNAYLKHTYVTALHFIGMYIVCNIPIYIGMYIRM